MTDSNKEKKPLHGYKKILRVLKSQNYVSFYILFILLGLCSLFYYFGELVIFFNWESLRWDFFYTVHDFHRLLFLIPIIYAAHVFNIKATLTITIISLVIMMPRAMFISTYPDATLRMILFIFMAGAIGWLIARNRRETVKLNRLEDRLRCQNVQLHSMLEHISDGVILIGPDYIIRYMNPGMLRIFGDGVGLRCYKHLHNRETPCDEICKLQTVIQGTAETYIYIFPNGMKYEVLSSPYVDNDGTTCQLSIFKKII